MNNHYCHNKIQGNESSEDFYSQFGQDKLLYDLFFKNKKDGFFVDIGASDGKDISNSYFFEKALGWKGVCIEPRLSAFNQLLKNRNCICENVAISNHSGTSAFIEYPGSAGVYSGLKDKYDTRHEKAVQTYISLEIHKRTEHEIETITFAKLCEKHNINHIDYCSIDTEGGELDILKSLNHSEVSIDCITIENNFNDNDIRHYLRSKKYIFLTKIGCDEIYISHNLFKRNKRGVLRERIRYEYYRLIPYKIRILLNKSGISKIAKMFTH